MSSNNILVFTLGLWIFLSSGQTVVSENLSPLTANSSGLTGKYFFGDGLGVNNHLHLTSDGNFTFQWQGCMGTYDDNEGRYMIERETLILSPQKPNIQEGFQGTPTRFSVITWGPRLYLVPEDRLLDFVNAINQGQEPRNRLFGNFYLREGDEKIPVSGNPTLSSQWQEYLLTEPIVGKIVQIGKDKSAIVNIGAQNGLKAGMLLTANPNDRRFAQLKVISVDENSAVTEKLYQNDKILENDTVSTKFLDIIPVP